MKLMHRSAWSLLLVPAFALIGAANQQHEWLGALVGGAIGLFFALLVMGLLPRHIINWMFPRS